MTLALWLPGASRATFRLPPTHAQSGQIVEPRSPWSPENCNDYPFPDHHGARNGHSLVSVYHQLMLNAANPCNNPHSFGSASRRKHLFDFLMFQQRKLGGCLTRKAGHFKVGQLTFERNHGTRSHVEASGNCHGHWP